MPSSQIRINKTKDLQEVLMILREQYKLLNDAEIVKLALSLMYMLSKERNELAWEAGLPILTFTQAQQASLKKGIREIERMERNGKEGGMSANEVMKEIDR